ncbi:MAG: hypothetical protein U0Q47_13080 [Mycobacterium sp.]
MVWVVGLVLAVLAVRGVQGMSGLRVLRRGLVAVMVGMLGMAVTEGAVVTAVREGQGEGRVGSAVATGLAVAVALRAPEASAVMVVLGQRELREPTSTRPALSVAAVVTVRMAVRAVWVGLVDWESLSVAMVLVVRGVGVGMRGRVVGVVGGVWGGGARGGGRVGVMVVMPGMAVVVGRAVTVV